MSTETEKKRIHNLSDDYQLIGNKDKQIKRRVGQFALLTFCLSVVYTIISLIRLSQIQSTWTDMEYLEWVSQPSIFYRTSFILDALSTALLVILFAILFTYFSEKNKPMALIGIIFIPMYGITNLICYLTQISIVPSIAAQVLSTSGDTLLASQLVVVNSYTALGFVSKIALTVFSIPCFVYGYMLFKDSKTSSGITLMVHGVLCIVDFIGFFMQSSLLLEANIMGGFGFLIGLLLLALDFRTKKVSSSK